MKHWRFALLICAGLTALAADAPLGRRGSSRQPVQSTQNCIVPAHPFDLILGRQTDRSITVSVLCYANTEGSLVFGPQSGHLTNQTPARAFKSGEPAEIVLSGLQPDTRYFYQFRSARDSSEELTFQTARPPGRPFVFTVVADSHLDEHTDQVIYQRTLADVRADAPDFHVDLGDTYMTEKHSNRAAATQQYLAQRYYLGSLGKSAPLFFVIGNHDGESPHDRGGDTDSLAVWANLMRKNFFPNPFTDDFYSGNSIPHPKAGLLEDYYAWEWGDALFVELDPFWFTSPSRGRGDNWSRSLGLEQYRWLQHTLKASHAMFKFVFIHHLVGGLDNQSRGGAEAAPLYEWGGRNADGTDGFRQNRPDWPMPIHQLLVQHGVSIVFHGHDHFYAKQELDGIVYQECPQPGYPGNGQAPRSAADYGYTHGTILGSPGHLRVSVAPDRATVEYVRTSLPAAPLGIHPPAAVAHRYTISAPGNHSDERLP